MLALHLDLQQRLMIVSLPPRPLQPPNLILIQPPPRRFLQLPPTNLRQSLLLLRRAQLGLEPRLHPYPERRVERDGVCVAAHVYGFGGCLAGCFYGEECVAQGLQLEGSGCVAGGDHVEGFEGGNGFGGG